MINFRENKMKKIYIYSILLLFAIGCKKELTQTPSNALAVSQAFVLPSDFNYAVLGAYGGFRGIGTTNLSSVYYGGADGGSMAITPDVLADNLILTQQGRRSEVAFFNYKYTGLNTWTMWGDAYAVILRSNEILTNLGKLSAGSFKDNIRAEALAIRALAHFDLLRLYAKSYTSASATDLGVPYVTSIDPTLLPARTPVKQAYDLVIKDLLGADSTIASDNGVGRFNKASVEGLLSRVYLYRGDWQNAVNEATASLTNILPANQIADTTQFKNIWTDATEADVLLKIPIPDADNIQIGVGYEQSNNGSVRAEYNIDYGFYQLYAKNDVRKSAYVDLTTFSGAKYNYIKKYFGRGAGNANTNDYKVLRVGEVLLNRAEANYQLGNFAAALADLNTLRSNRYIGFVPGAESGLALYNAILLQRRLELAFEGSRFFDLKRLNLPIMRSNYGDLADGTGVPAVVQMVPAGSTLFQLPIPQSEINVNPNIVQNPGY